MHSICGGGWIGCPKTSRLAFLFLVRLPGVVKKLLHLFFEFISSLNKKTHVQSSLLHDIVDLRLENLSKIGHGDTRAEGVDLQVIRSCSRAGPSCCKCKPVPGRTSWCCKPWAFPEPLR